MSQCEVGDCDNAAQRCQCGNAHCLSHPHSDTDEPEWTAEDEAFAQEARDFAESDEGKAWYGSSLYRMKRIENSASRLERLAEMNAPIIVIDSEIKLLMVKRGPRWMADLWFWYIRHFKKTL